MCDSTIRIIIKIELDMNILQHIKQSLFTVMGILIGFNAIAYDFQVNDNLFFEILSTLDLTCKLDSVNENYEGDLIIPEKVSFKGKELTVTAIGSNIIRSCTKLTTITVPTTLTEMDEFCFSSCISLQTANIQSINPSILPKGCFSYSAVREVIWPDMILEFSEECFKGCPNLGDFKIPESVVNIGDECFKLAKLNSIYFPTSIRSIGASAFEQAEIETSINLPEGLLTINDYAYKKAAVPQVYIPASVSELGNGIFESCEVSKVDFSVGSNIQNLPTNMFKECSLDDISFPPYLKSIGDGCFTNCKNISRLNFPNTIESLGYRSLAGLNLDLLCLSENLNFINYECFNDNTSIKKLIWSVANLNENFFDAAVNSEKYYELEDLQDASFNFGSIEECEIDSNCEFLYLGWISAYNNGASWYHTRYFVFEKSYLQKLTLLDSPNPLTLASVYHFSGSHLGKKYVHMYKGSFPNGDETVYSYFLSTWMESLKELYIGREIEGNPIYAPNLEHLTIGHVEKVDIENTLLPNLKLIECVSDTPPIINENHFSKDQYLDLLVVVPDDAIENYQNADVWKNFWNIKSKSEYEAIVNVTGTYAEKREVARYDYCGQKVNSEYRGIVIICYSDGSTKKTIQ